MCVVPTIGATHAVASLVNGPGVRIVLVSAPSASTRMSIPRIGNCEEMIVMV